MSEELVPFSFGDSEGAEPAPLPISDEPLRFLKKHNEETINTALLALAVTGNGEAAARICGVPPRTIRDFRKRYPRRFQALAEKHAASIEKAMVAKIREGVIQAQDVAYEAVELERTRIRSGEIKDAAGSARNLATVAGIGVTKVLELEGRPTSIVRHERSGEDILRSLAALGHVDSTAEEERPELPPAA